jgi:hypothetical protein
MRRRDVVNRIARLEREWGLSASQRSSQAYFKRFEAALTAYEAERDRITVALPPGWRLVTDYLVKAGKVLGVRHRATNDPPETENGFTADLESRKVIDVFVQHGGLTSSRPACEGDAKWRAEDDRALPDDLRRAIRALKIVSFIDFINHEPF